ncbi:hypothetical protein ABBQ32_004891 [Trebouxia sp. C0010 RCD-2024]
MAAPKLDYSHVDEGTEDRHDGLLKKWVVDDPFENALECGHLVFPPVKHLCEKKLIATDFTEVFTKAMAKFEELTNVDVLLQFEPATYSRDRIVNYIVDFIKGAAATAALRTPVTGTGQSNKPDKPSDAGNTFASQLDVDADVSVPDAGTSEMAIRQMLFDKVNSDISLTPELREKKLTKIKDYLDSRPAAAQPSVAALSHADGRNTPQRGGHGPAGTPKQGGKGSPYRRGQGRGRSNSGRGYQPFYQPSYQQNWSPAPARGRGAQGRGNPGNGRGDTAPPTKATNYANTYVANQPAGTGEGRPMCGWCGKVGHFQKICRDFQWYQNESNYQSGQRPLGRCVLS